MSMKGEKRDMTALFQKLGDDRSSLIPISLCRPNMWDNIETSFSPMQRRFAAARNFKGDAGQRVRLPDETGEIAHVLFGVGAANKDDIGPIRVGQLSAFLPKDDYYIAHAPDDWPLRLIATGWGMGAYKFDAYLKETADFPILHFDMSANPREVSSIIDALHFGRDLINIPAGDMGPVALHQAVTDLAAEFDAEITETIGDALLDENLPMIHAVGRAAHEEPRLIEFEWGEADHPRLALVGKGITFDTGGLNIKSANSARLMKKDMGGAAHALALAKMIMANNLPIRLHVLISIAENAISAGAYRPGDVLSSRAGLTVEIDNTDAEGRLVLGDALTKAAEYDPALMINFATLTGAARVALGPQLAPFYCNRENPVAEVLQKAKDECDPIWHMPLWRPYKPMLNSPIADMKNAGGGMAGSVTAGLFLQNFVKDKPWMHFDVYGWAPTTTPGHPKGGEIFATRALYSWLKAGGLGTDLTH